MSSPRAVDPEITEEMLTAAMAALARWNGGRPHTISTLEVRHALTAALRVQKIGDVKGLVELRKAVSSRAMDRRR